jgi:hypothetical protein
MALLKRTLEEQREGLQPKAEPVAPPHVEA